MSLQDPTLQVVFHQKDTTQPIDGERRFAAISLLLEKGYSVSRVHQDTLPPLPGNQSLLVFEEGAPSNNGKKEEAGSQPFTHEPLNGQSPEQLAESVEARRNANQAAAPGEWKPWFPVIDYDRCTNCMQCLSFCLFDVYGVDAQQRIQVQNNDNCKTNCPACSRVCPEAAIMFPKYKAGPINGAPVSDEDLQREKMKVDISALLGGDVYELLRDRSARAKSRFSKERSSDKALNERQKCLTKLASAGDIPPEVLMNLPSSEEIQRRSEEAQSKAQAARERQISHQK